MNFIYFCHHNIQMLKTENLQILKNILENNILFIWISIINIINKSKLS